MRYCFCCCVEYVFSWTSLDALMLCLFIAVYLCSPCFCVEVTVSLSLFPLVCPSVLLLLLNDSYFYLTKMKYESMMMQFFLNVSVWHLLTFTCYIHCLCFTCLWFVTRHPSPPTSLRFWSALGWLVIMLMQLCSIKVSAPRPLPTRNHNHSPPSAFACLPPASTQWLHCILF